MRSLFATLTISSALVIATIVACGGGSSAKIDAPVDTFTSTCGHPGDMGNEMGIGKFCLTISDCSGTPAPLCSSLGDPTTHFCTKTCQGSGSAGQCGTATMCVCQGGGTSGPCGCTPTACLGP